MAKILIVDDRPSNRLFLTTLLGYGGHQLLEAADGAAALELVRSGHPDLVITDILMPTMDGYELVQRIRADPDAAPTPVIFHTATYSAAQAEALAKTCGVTKVLSKACDPQTILAAVNQALGICEPPALPHAARDPGAGATRPADDTMSLFSADLEDVRLGFENIVSGSATPRAGRDAIKDLSKKFAQNVASMQRVTTRLSALIEVGMEMMSERDPARLVELFFAAACDLIGSDYAAIGMLDESAREIRHAFAKGFDAALLRGDNGRKGLLETLLSGRALLRKPNANATAGIEGLPKGHPEVRDLLGLPVSLSNRTYGWIYFAGRQGQSGFSDEDVRIASVMTRKLALLYENAMLYDTVQRHAAKLQIEASERKLAVRSLRESDLRFRQLAENIHQVFFLINPAGTQILYVSPAYEDIWQRSTSSLYENPQSWTDPVHPDDKARVLASFEQMENTGRLDYEYRIARADGSLRWIHARGFPIRDDAGEIYRIAGIAEDITDRKRAAEELRESERRFSDMLENVELVSLMLDREARITYCNDYLLRLTGWRREEVTGRNWFELFIPPENTPSKDVHAALLAESSIARHHEDEILTRSGERRLIRWNNSVLRSGARNVVGTASIGEDITGQKRAEIKIRGLNRVYAVLSGINALIMRVRDRDELFREACRIAVEHGQFKMAWIGVVDRSAMTIVPIASAGAEPEFLTLVKDRFSLREDVPMGNTMSARAVREKKAIVSNEIRSDAKVLLAKERIGRGISSMAVLPLLVLNDAVGVLALYAGETGFFDDDEMKLLLELAGDISFALEHIEKTERLDYLAYYDSLTGLANQSLFLERLEETLHSVHDEGRKKAVYVLDIERFKSINDAFGRQAGDELLKQLAKRLVEIGRGDASRFARVGADRFAIAAPAMDNLEQVGRYTEERFDAAFRAPFQVGGEDLRVSVRMGVAVFPDDGADADELLRNAEAALKKAKAAGERYLFFTQAMTEHIAERLSLENKLRQALEKDEFVLYYQPKVDPVTRNILGVEALIRWQSPELGLVPPMDFIPLLEQTGLILEAGAWALRRAALDHRGWVEAGLRAPRVAVNVSPIQLAQRDFVGIVEQALIEGVAPTGIDLEITESLIMVDIQGNIEKLNAIRALGVSIAIDDFGTGHSSLAYLARLPVATLKIDRSFVIGMLDDPNATTLIRTMISLAHSLRLTVVAEGVETEEQEKMLHLLGCDQMQGYLFSEPLPLEGMTALLQRTPGAGGG